MDENKLHMNLQFFAEDQPEDAPETNETGEEVTEKQDNNEEVNKPAEKTFTQSEVDELIKKRLERERQKAENAKKEAEKLAEMSAKERTEFEMNKLKSEKEQAETDLARYRMRDEARKMFVDGGYTPTDDELSMLVTSDAETTQTNVKAYQSMIARVKEQARNELLKGTTPKSNAGKEVKPSKPLETMTYEEAQAQLEAQGLI